MSKYLFLIFTLLFQFIHASEGDLDPNFIKCVDNCTEKSCPSTLDFSLRLLQWTCSSNCNYTCMQIMTDKAIHEHTPIYQYFGKWPFYRVYGIQEPASVMFSIGNGLVHLYFFRLFQKNVPKNYYLRPFMLLYTIIGINAWFWSTVFHSRDVKFTELMDYFSAGFFVSFTFYFALLRVFHIQQRYHVQLLGLVFIVLYVAHVTYLTCIVFDYVYNMAANVVMGMCQILTWVGWFLWQVVHKQLRPYSHLAVIPGLGVLIALGLELFDFPPLWRVLDAHSLWHLSTIPLSIIWYHFLIEDMYYETQLSNHYTSILPT